MKFDIFLSICQTEVDGYLPSEKTMFRQFFDQVWLADQLGYEVAWVAETHLSCEIQKRGKQPVIPHFVGEIGLNTDILQLAAKVFSRTRRIHVGSAIRNILCNGGPIAHAEALSTALALHGLDDNESRRIHWGFASGRFDFSNRPYGIRPRNEFEQKYWPHVRNGILRQATEIFLRLLKGETIASDQIAPLVLNANDIQDVGQRQAFVQDVGGQQTTLPSFYEFETVGIIPKDIRRELLTLQIGTHDPELQIRANQIWPVGVFNLSITPPAVIEETHARMKQHYHPDGGEWQRWMMPRTTMIFLDRTSARAKERAQAAWSAYWKAMEGTLDPEKVKKAVDNTLAGEPEEIAERIREKYHPEDRLMLWFDFNNHDHQAICWAMQTFIEKVAPQLS